MGGFRVESKLYCCMVSDLMMVVVNRYMERYVVTLKVQDR